MRSKVKETLELKQFRESLTARKCACLHQYERNRNHVQSNPFQWHLKTINVSASMPSHFYQASHPEKAALCCPVQKEKKEAASQACTCLVQCIGGSLSRLQEGNHGLAQANCSWLKNLQVAKIRAQMHIPWLWIPFSTTLKAPQSLLSCLRRFSLCREYHSSTYFLIQQIFAGH